MYTIVAVLLEAPFEDVIYTSGSVSFCLTHLTTNIKVQCIFACFLFLAERNIEAKMRHD